MNKAPQGRSALVVALTTGLFLVAGFILHEPMVLFAYPNVTYASVDQYFWHKMVTAVSFSLLGFSLGIYYWVCSRKSVNHGLVRSLLGPVVMAAFLLMLGLLYYRHEYLQIAANSSAAEHSVAMMIEAVAIHYIPLALSLVALAAVGWRWFRKPAPRHSARRMDD